MHRKPYGALEILMQRCSRGRSQAPIMGWPCDLLFDYIVKPGAEAMLLPTADASFLSEIHKPTSFC